jgi:hypothetical protein
MKSPKLILLICVAFLVTNIDAYGGGYLRGGSKNKTNIEVLYGIDKLTMGTQEYDCSAGVNRTLQQYTIINLIGRPQDLTPDEIIALEEGFATAYERIGALYCRKVVEVEIIQSVARRRSLLFNFGNRSSSVTMPFAFLYRIIFQC